MTSVFCKFSGEVIYPCQEFVLGRPTFRYLRDLERSQWSSRDEIESLQGRKLARLLQIAQAYCPWHAARIAAAGLDNLRDQKTVSDEDLQRIPTMSKLDAQEYGEQMRWRDVPGGSFDYNTGGSSGTPLRFEIGRWRQASDAAARIRARRWWGVEVGEPEVYLWGAPVELNKTDVIKSIRDRLLNQLVLNAFEMSAINMDAYLKAIARFDPVCIYGYASSLAQLASHARETGSVPKLDRLRVVCTTGEPLFSHQRELISDVFKAPVANEFGSRDIGFTAHETPSGQMLLVSESLILEVLDANGNPVGSGVQGEAVITGLCSDAQPFIRYRTGDMVALAEQPCEEGRGLHVLESVSGRTTDFVVKCDGTLMHALSVIYIMRGVKGVKEFKIIQHDLERIEVQIVTNLDWVDSAHSDIEKQFRLRIGPGVSVQFVKLDAIPAQASGKHRYVECRVLPKQQEVCG